MKKIYFIIFILIACNKPADSTVLLDELSTLMSGSFSNKDQMDEKYSNIIQSVSEIWKGTPTEKWLLERQSLSINPDDAFRQRIYHLVLNEEGIIQMDILLPPNSKMKSTVDELKNISKDSLTTLSGCSIYFRKENSIFIGATFGDQCENTYQRANHIIEQFEISSKEFKTWVIGYDEKGNIVWGSEAGANKFRRQGE